MPVAGSMQACKHTFPAAGSYLHVAELALEIDDVVAHGGRLARACGVGRGGKGAARGAAGVSERARAGGARLQSSSPDLRAPE